jgi:hypothetical protein
MPAPAYHADPCPEPSLSSTIVKMLCLESAAHAQYAHPRLRPLDAADDDDHTGYKDLGTAAHALLLEGATCVTVIDAPDFRTKAAQAARELAYAEGRVPLLATRWREVQAMVACARAQLARHTDGGAAMFTDGQPEQTVVWQEDDGTWCRARLDWYRPGAIDDYKTTSASANPDTWTRTMFTAGHDIQAAWYLRGFRALTGTDAVFRFAVQEAYPPYALAVIGLGPDALVLAEKKCLYALDRWRDARRRNHWPGYAARTCWATLPMAHEAWWLEKEMR